MWKCISESKVLSKGPLYFGKGIGSRPIDSLYLLLGKQACLLLYVSPYMSCQIAPDVVLFQKYEGFSNGEKTMEETQKQSNLGKELRMLQSIIELE